MVSVVHSKYLDLQLNRHIQMQCTLKQEYSELIEDVCGAFSSQLFRAKSGFLFFASCVEFWRFR